MDELVLTPTECVALVNQTLEIAYPTVMVEGEVVSFKYSRDKYVFFDLKDQEATLGCFMMAWQLRTPLEDGMRVKVLAEPRLTRWGKFSLTIRQVMPVGQGSIKKAFELLRAKLEAEGLLDDTRKRSLPRVPRHVAVISSVEAAGYADFMKILRARWGGLRIQVANVQVQGLAAVQQNIAAITHFNQQAEPPDVLVIIRGGGSADDLAAYNDEQLARAIAASRIPTLVGVGHEVDTSLADLVADVRAATPSNAAQLLVPDRQEVQLQLQAVRRRLVREAEVKIAHWQQKVGHGGMQIERAVDTRDVRMRLRHHQDMMVAKHHHFMAQLRQAAHGHVRMLRQLDPQMIVRRGYAIVRQHGKIVQGSQLTTGEVELEMTNARVTAEVIEITTE